MEEDTEWENKHNTRKEMREGREYDNMKGKDNETKKQAS